MNIIDRGLVAHMTQMQNMIDVPPAPRLDPMTGRLMRHKATEQEIRGEDLFSAKPVAQPAINRPGIRTIRCMT